MRPMPRVSIILATHNRRDVVIETLHSVAECGLPRNDYEVIMVDNASTDGTPEAARGLADVVLPLARNSGSTAKAIGVDHAQGSYLVFLDDDARPRPGTLPAMVERFERNSSLAAAGFTVHLPDGRRECGALPGVFVGCGVGLRAEAVRAVGGLDQSFFMQAEEYDLCFRLVNEGWRIAVFDDLHVDHLKSPQARRSARTTYFDTRNNLRVAARYFPDEYYDLYGADWRQRYDWLAWRDGHRTAFLRGWAAGLIRGGSERRAYRGHRLDVDALEFFFRWNAVEAAMRSLAADGVKRIALADLGKNVYAFYRGAMRTGLEIRAVADDRFAAPGRTYRGIPVLSSADALELRVDAIVVANAAPVHAQTTKQRLLDQTTLPVHCWFGTSSEVRPVQPVCGRDAYTADEQPELAPVGAGV